MFPLVLGFICQPALWIFRGTERSAVVRDRLLRPATMLFLESALRAWRQGGPEAWNRWHLPLARAFGEARAAYLAAKLGIDPENALSLGASHDYEGPLPGITGHCSAGDESCRFVHRLPSRF